MSEYQEKLIKKLEAEIKFQKDINKALREENRELKAKIDRLVFNPSLNLYALRNRQLNYFSALNSQYFPYA